MSLFRCSNLLNRVNVGVLSLKPHPVVYYSDDKKSSDDGEAKKSDVDKKKTDKKESLVQTRDRLKSLLGKLSSNSTLKIVQDVQTAKPKGYKNIVKTKFRDDEPKKPRKVIDAVKAVAAEIGDKKTADELLDSLNETQTDIEPPTQTKRSDKKSKRLSTPKEPKAEPNLLDNVFATMKKPRSFPKPFKAHEKDSESASEQKGTFIKKPFDDTSLVGNFKPASKSETENIKSTFKRRTPIFARVGSREQTESDASSHASTLNIFGGEPMNLFESEKLIEQQDPLKTWDRLEKYELKLSMSFAARNYFEKMAYWTEEGKVWHFPIDNEQGLDKENNTSFVEHVFLDELLEPWCPKKGALRNFMELVCIGLSKNPYLTVEEKHEHIFYYRDYFEAKREVLKRVIEENRAQKKEISDGNRI